MQCRCDDICSVAEGFRANMRGAEAMEAWALKRLPEKLREERISLAGMLRKAGVHDGYKIKTLSEACNALAEIVEAGND